MIQLGVTGGIGSGKSTVCSILEKLQIPVYYADDEAKKILESEAVRKRLIALFGAQIVDASDQIDRKQLAALVFVSPEKLEQLNQVIHPAVAAHYKEWLNQHQSFPIVAKEAAILFESKSYLGMDKVVTVYAPEKLRLARAMKRSNQSRKEILARMKNQISEKEKMERSDFVLINDEKKLLIPQVIKMIEKLKS